MTAHIRDNMCEELPFAGRLETSSATSKSCPLLHVFLQWIFCSAFCTSCVVQFRTFLDPPEHWFSEQCAMLVRHRHRPCSKMLRNTQRPNVSSSSWECGTCRGGGTCWFCAGAAGLSACGLINGMCMQWQHTLVC